MATSTTPSSSQQFLESVLPGATNLTQSATGVIGNLLNGLPSASQARTTNAYWGVGAGQPATGDINSFIGQRGTDLYNQQANANQQTGLGDLLNTIGTYTSPALQNQAQQNQVSQFGQNYQLQQFQSMLQALGLGNQIVGNPQSTGGSGQSTNQPVNWALA